MQKISFRASRNRRTYWKKALHSLSPLPSAEFINIQVYCFPAAFLSPTDRWKHLLGRRKKAYVSFGDISCLQKKRERYSQFMSSRTFADAGAERLLLVALQDISVLTSLRPRFTKWSSLRVKPSFMRCDELPAKRPFLYQVTVGGGFPTGKIFL